MTFEQLQFNWGASVCGRSIERYIFDSLTGQIESLETELAALKETNRQLLEQSTKDDHTINDLKLQLSQVPNRIQKSIEASLEKAQDSAIKCLGMESKLIRESITDESNHVIVE